jgi:hypothetical protein
MAYKFGGVRDKRVLAKDEFFGLLKNKGKG